MQNLDLDKTLTFGFEQTFTVPDWWSDEGFTATSDTPLKREKMLALAQEIAKEIGGDFKESVDIWNHMQYETFFSDGRPSFVVTMDPGSIEVKSQPCLASETEEMARPLFAAAQRAGVVPYRNWWYGIKGATEGGCHVNMGGFSDETNPLKLRPDLAVKYCAYIHNRPWLHYPFMGLDTGPEGNAMRMDEKTGFEQVKDAFSRYRIEMSADQVYELFKDTNLIAEKASFPSLFKLKPPFYFIEDRAQEALRAPEEFFYVSDLRLKIMQSLQEQAAPETLQHFEDLSGKWLVSGFLWKRFLEWASGIDIDPERYRRFFERQFQVLEAGARPPEGFLLKEGRRPRVVTDIVKRGDTVVSKTIDTSYKRFELCGDFSPEDLAEGRLKADAAGIEKVSGHIKGAPGLNEKEFSSCVYIDVKVDQDKPVLKIQFGKEEARFNMNDMMWT